MRKASVVMSRLRAPAGFTLVELIAAVALLVILLAILFFVFHEAGSSVSIAQDRVECYRTVRAIFRLLEEDITNAFLMADAGTTYGFTGENAVAADGAFLDPAPDGDSDRLTLIRPRRAPGTDEPGFMEVRFSRFTYGRGQELASDRRHCFFRAIDDNAGSGWTPGSPFPSAIFAFDAPDPDPTDNANNDYYRNQIVALDLSDLQFEYLKIDQSAIPPAPVWQSTWAPDTDTYDPDGPGGQPAGPSLPLEVRVTIRLPRGSAYRGSTNPDDHQTFTHVVHLPTAPWAP